MSLLLFIFGAIGVCLGVLAGLAAPSDIQLTMAAVLVTSALLAFGLAVLLGRASANAESLARIEHYLASKEEEASQTK